MEKKWEILNACSYLHTHIHTYTLLYIPCADGSDGRVRRSDERKGAEVQIDHCATNNEDIQENTIHQKINILTVYVVGIKVVL